MKRVLAFDPGVTTGWCYCDGTGAYETGTFMKWLLLESLLASYSPDVVVVEKFVLYPSAARYKIWSDFPTVEVIGVTRFLCGKLLLPMVLQGANEVASLRIETGLLPTKHEQDALRHAILYYRRNKLDGPYRDYYRIRTTKKKYPNRPRRR